MAIHDNPAECEIGDGVLASKVLHLDEFHTTKTTVQYLPEKPLDLFATAVISKMPVAVEVPRPWIFALGKYNVGGGEVVDAWRRES